MAEKAQWVTFESDSDEALSLSDLPISKPENINPFKEEIIGDDDQFEFRILSAGNNNSNSSAAELLCAAEDVFFDGQLLPLGPTRPVSRSDSAASLCFDGGGSSSSSTSVSRSLSSSSSSELLAPRAQHHSSLSRIRSNTLCACPSPSPRVKSVGRNVAGGGGGGGGRRSTGTAPPAGWGLLRLGVAMAPEMEMSDIRVRLARGGSAKNVVEKRGNHVLRLMGCKCSPEDAVSAKERGEGRRRRRRVAAGFMERRERMFQWLEDLSLGKEPLVKFRL